MCLHKPQSDRQFPRWALLRGRLAHVLDHPHGRAGSIAAGTETPGARRLLLNVEIIDEDVQDRGHSRRRNRHGSRFGRGRGAACAGQARRRLPMQSRPFRLGRRILQEAWSNDAGERPQRDQGPRCHPVLIVRENSEGEYAGVGGRVHQGLPLEMATDVAMFTRAGVERIMRFAFRLAQSRPRKLLTVVTKSNAQRHAMVMWDEIATEIATEFKDVTWDK